MIILSLVYKMLRKIKISIFNRFYTPYAKLQLILNNVSFGEKLRVKGFMRVFVTKRGVFEIGHENRFNSGPKFNVSGGSQRMNFWVDGILKIGNNVGMSSSSILCKHHISIGNNVIIGGNTLIIDSDSHSLDALSRITKSNDMATTKSGEVTIGNNVFIGARSVILKNVTIGENVIVGASSVVTKSIPANELWGGNPAKFIRKIK